MCDLEEGAVSQVGLILKKMRGCGLWFLGKSAAANHAEFFPSLSIKILHPPGGEVLV